MWCKVVILAFFLVLLFLLSRLREGFAYYGEASPLLDPMSLSIKKLKLLLDQRDVSYAGVLEKHELKELVQATGDASAGELEMATKEDESSKYTEFEDGSHFYEEVEDCKDSVWVLQIVRSKKLFMVPKDWSSFVHKVSRFGVHTGYFNCALDEKFCARKGWYSPRLVLALPQGHKAKDNVILKNYVGSSRTQPVLDWVNSNLASRIKQIQTLDELKADWLNFDHDRQNLRVILVSTLTVPPMFYSVLSVKFRGRAHFGTIDSGTATGQKILKATQWTKVPSFVVLMPEKEYKFGLSPGEYPNFSSMALFLKTLHPDVNDMFLLSLIMVNVMCWFELVLSRGNLFKRLGSFMWHVCKWNCLLILLYFPVLGMFQLPYMTMVLEGSLKLLRLVGTSFPASLMRADWLAYYSNNLPFLLAVLSAYTAVIGFVYYKVRGSEPDTTLPSIGPNIDWNTYRGYANVLFAHISNFWHRFTRAQLDHPTIQLASRRVRPDSSLEVTFRPRHTSHQDRPDRPPEAGHATPTTSHQWRPDRPDRPPEGGHATPTTIYRDGLLLPEWVNSRAGTVGPHYPDLIQIEQLLQTIRLRPRISNEYLKELPVWRYTGPNIDSDDGSDTQTYQPQPATICSICQEELKFGETLCGLPCKHSYHRDCIMRWLEEDNHLCPLCRWPAYKAQHGSDSDSDSNSD